MTQALSRGEALVALRRAMQQARVSACLIPSADPHLSEYLPAYWQIRQWLTGFTGSVGTVVVTQDFAGIWVDSRYWVQAEAELAGSGVTLMKIGVATDPAHAAWLAEHVPPGGVVAVDGRALGLAAREALMEQFAAHQIRLDLSLDLPGQCWLDRPALPSAPVRDLPVEIAGQSRQEKLARVRTEMVARGAQWHLVSTLDDIAWLLNLRGEDVSFNPVFLAHVLIGPERVWLFVLPGKIDAALAQELALDGIEVRPYYDAGQALAELDQDARLLFDPARTTCALIDRVPCELVRAINPSTFFKSQKTPFELGHGRVAGS